MSGTFEVFRKNQKLVMAGLCVILILGWVVGDSLLKIFGGSDPSRGKGSVYATWKYGTLRDADVGLMRQMDGALNDFLYRAAPQEIDPRFGAGKLRATPDDRLLAQMLLAKKGDQLGLQISDEQVLEYLRQETARAHISSLGQFRDSNIVEQLLQSPSVVEQMAATPNQMASALKKAKMTQTQLFSLAKKRLMASRVESLLFSGLTADAATPSERFDEFVKKEQQYTIEALPLNVKDFVAEVDTKGMTDEELKKLYEEYKDKYSGDGKPGFKIPYKAAFNYYRANLAEFVAKVEPEVTDKQVADEYEKTKDDYPEEEKKPDADKKPDGEKKPDDKKPDEKTPDEKKPESKDGEKPAIEKKDGDAKSEDKPVTKPEVPAEKTETPPTDKSANPATEKKDNAAVTSARIPASFVSFQPEEAGKKDDADKKDAKPDDPAKADATKGDATKSDPPAVDPAKKADETKPSDTPATNTDKKEDPARPFDLNKPIDTTKTDATKPAKKLQPLEAVKGKVRTKLATAIAIKRIREAFGKVEDTVLQHGNARKEYRILKAADPKTEEPFAPNFADIGKPLGLQITQTPMSSYPEFRAIPGVGAGIFPAGLSAEVISYADYAYSSGDRMPEYQTQQVESPGWMYLIWKTEEAKEYVPTFEQAKEAVITAWKNAAATKLVERKADELLKIAKEKSDLRLEKTLGNVQKNVVIEVGPFSWRKQQGLQDRYDLSVVEGITDPGNDFMKSVYALQAGEIGLAWNQPKTILYVVRVSKLSKSLDDLVMVFLAQAKQYRFGDYEPRRELATKWFDSLKQEMDYKVVRAGSQQDASSTEDE